MFFAIIFPFLYKWIITSSKQGRALIALLFASMYFIVAVLLPVDKYHAILYIAPYMRLTDFVFGIYLALIFSSLKEKSIKWRNEKVISQLIPLLLIALLVVESCVLPKDLRLIAPVYWLFIGLLILSSSLMLTDQGGNLINNKYFQRLGEISFIIFMIHQIVLRYTTLLFEDVLHIENCIVYIVLTLFLTIFLSLVIEQHILKPITQWLTKRNQQSMTARS